MPVRVTVTGGTCQGNVHMVGQQYTVKATTPEGMCVDAWTVIAPYVTTLLRGGTFPWEKDEGTVQLHCPDPKGITFLLERVD